MLIKVDATTSGTQTTATSLTFSHTCSGSNRILWVSVVGDLTSDLISGVTYNGVSMTLAGKVKGSSPRWVYLYYLLNPATGTNNVVISASSSTYIAGGSVSYNNVKQSGQPDASGTSSSGSVSSVTPTVTTVANNCWLIAIVYRSPGEGLSAGANTFLRASGNGFNDISIFDSNGRRGTGSQSLNVTVSPSASTGVVVASFSPSATIKTINGVAIENIKTINGVAIENVKSFDGIS